MKKIILVLSVLSAGVAVYATHDISVVENTDFINALITAFSIIAGAILAVFGIILAPYRTASWQGLANNRQMIVRDIILFKTLFLCYVFSLLLILLSLLIKGTFSELTHVIQQIYIFVGTFALVYSLYLPFKISEIILGEVDATIQQGQSQKK